MRVGEAGRRPRAARLRRANLMATIRMDASIVRPVPASGKPDSGASRRSVRRLAAETRPRVAAMLIDMTATAGNQGVPRELAHREGDGLEVTLFWHPATDRLTVCVCDHRHGVYLEILAAPDCALDVYNHPFAYRDFSTVDYEDSRLAV